MKCVALAFGALAAMAMLMPEPATAQGAYGQHRGQMHRPPHQTHPTGYRPHRPYHPQYRVSHRSNWSFRVRPRWGYAPRPYAQPYGMPSYAASYGVQPGYDQAAYAQPYMDQSYAAPQAYVAPQVYVVPQPQIIVQPQVIVQSNPYPYYVQQSWGGSWGGGCGGGYYRQRCGCC